MDNESFGMQIIKNHIRSIYFNIQYLGKKILSVEEGSDKLKEMLKSDKPFMCCRVGATEGRTIQQWMKKKPYTDRDINNIRVLSGVFPCDKESLDRFCEIYTDGISNADAVFTWGCIGEANAIKKFASKKITLLRNDTYNILFYHNPWTKALKGKKVLIVHPFIDTIKEQYEQNREKLFTDELLPEFADICFVRAIQTSAGENEGSNYSSWFDALHCMEKEIETKDFDVALIGAGAYGIPLAAHVKKMGKQAIHMAGNLQIVFGIRGKRWDNFPEYVKYFNEYWVYPSENETPSNKGSVEGGSYWK